MLSSCSLFSSAQPAINQDDKPPVRGPPSYFRQSPLSYQQSSKGRSRLALGAKGRHPTEFFRSLLGAKPSCSRAATDGCVFGMLQQHGSVRWTSCLPLGSS